MFLVLFFDNYFSALNHCFNLLKMNEEQLKNRRLFSLQIIDLIKKIL